MLLDQLTYSRVEYGVVVARKNIGQFRVTSGEKMCGSNGGDGESLKGWFHEEWCIDLVAFPYLMWQNVWQTLKSRRRIIGKGA